MTILQSYIKNFNMYLKLNYNTYTQIFFLYLYITSDNDILSEVITIRKLGLNGPILYSICLFAY